MHIWNRGCAVRTDFGTWCPIFCLFWSFLPSIPPTKCTEMPWNHPLLMFHPLMGTTKDNKQFNAHLGLWFGSESWFWHLNAPYFGLFWAFRLHYYLPNVWKCHETSCYCCLPTHRHNQWQLAVRYHAHMVPWLCSESWFWYLNAKYFAYFDHFSSHYLLTNNLKFPETTPRIALMMGRIWWDDKRGQNKTKKRSELKATMQKRKV